MKIRRLALFGGLVFTLSMIPMILSSGQTYTIFAHNMIWATGGGAYITAKQSDLGPTTLDGGFWAPSAA